MHHAWLMQQLSRPVPFCLDWHCQKICNPASEQKAKVVALENCYLLRMKSKSLSANKQKSPWLGGMETRIPMNSRKSKTVENVSHEKKKKQSLSHMEVEIIQCNKPKFTAKQLTTVAVSFPGSGSINSSSFSFEVSRAQAFLNTCLKKKQE